MVRLTDTFSLQANSIAMKNLYCVFLFILVLFIFQQSSAQTTGIINRAATTAAGRTVLDPNGDGYTSATSGGYGSSDVTNSEISFVSVPTYSIEPYGDLRRGPNHLYSDFVPDANGNGVYMTYSDGNLIFRFRVGSIMPGSKGYSILIDTDNKFGATGANADPNYQAATTGTNGNPGFEIEVVLETNFRIAIYNVDGSSTPTLIKSYTNWQDMSQVSVAGTFDNGDPDFFIDFYIPFSDLTTAPFNLTTSSDLRFSATTVMSPQAAIGGPKSDIYGLSDDGYKNTNTEYETYINTEPPVKISTLSSGFGAMCTAAPTVNSPIGTGTVTISGTWTKSSLSGAVNTATITVYKNGVSVGTVSNVSSGSTWTLNSVTVANGDVITAKAQAAGESMCLVSNSVIALGCQPSNMSSVSAITITCGSLRGFDGTAPTNAIVRIYTVTPSGYTLFADETTTSYKVNRSGTRWYYDGANVNSSDPCTGGATDVPAASYAITIQEPGKCESDYYYYCNGLGASTATPVITQANLYSGNLTISGTTASGATVRLFVNGQFKSSVVATGVNYSFSNVILNTGNVVDIYAQSTGQCISAKTTRVVTCFTSVPIINADNNNQITAGAPITGTSGESSGTVIKVYTSGGSLVATTTVQANGTWSTGNAGTTPGIYNAAAGTIYYATAQNGSCSESSASANATAVVQTSGRCGNITGPVTTGSTSVSGTLTGAVASTVVNLYMDGVNIGTTTTATTGWTITVSSTALYPNGTLTIGVQESGKQELLCPASLVVGCSSSPTAPVISPASSTITQNQSVTYTISNAVAGNFYGIADASTGQSLATGVWATVSGNLSITTIPFNSSGSYTAVVKATSLSGLTVCSSLPVSSSVAVNSTLPVHFLNVSANKAVNGVNVDWIVTNEQDVAYYIVEKSKDCIHFETAGRVEYKSDNAATKQYQFFDKEALAPKICYRIKQVDRNGSSHYSTIVLLKNSTDNLIQLIPNPASDKTTVMITSLNDELITIELINVNGKQVRQQRAELRKGNNAIVINGLASMSRGVYIIKIETSDGINYQKLIIQ